MKEIRICWQPTVVHDHDYDDRLRPCGGWRTLDRELLRNMQILRDAANQVYGAGSHWLETRSISRGAERGDDCHWQPPAAKPPGGKA
jgi:hypothetical protein